MSRIVAAIVFLLFLNSLVTSAVVPISGSNGGSRPGATWDKTGTSTLERKTGTS